MLAGNDVTVFTALNAQNAERRARNPALPLSRTVF
jgi:hypothetical protein